MFLLSICTQQSKINYFTFRIDVILGSVFLNSVHFALIYKILDTIVNMNRIKKYDFLFLEANRNFDTKLVTTSMFQIRIAFRNSKAMEE